MSTLQIAYVGGAPILAGILFRTLYWRDLRRTDSKASD